MNLTINGENKSQLLKLWARWLAHLGMKPDRVAIELNREIVPATNGRKLRATA